MKLAFTDQNRLVVNQIYSLLESRGIDVTYRNEYAGGAVGELSPLDSWLEVWVVNDDEHARARALIDDTLSESNPAEQWVCGHCQEVNASSFEICWKCGHENDLA